MKHRRKVLIVICFAVLTWFSADMMVGIQQKKEVQSEYTKSQGQIVVIFKDKIAEKELKAEVASVGAGIDVLRHMDDYALLSIKEASEYQNVLEDLKKNPKVQTAEANCSVTTLGITNDYYADTQWAINNKGKYLYLADTGETDKQSVEDIDMDVAEAWKAYDEKVQGARQVVVAVVDTGVDYKHPDLAENMWTNPGEIPEDGIDNDNNGYIDDVYGWDFYNKDSSVCHYKYMEEYGVTMASSEDKDDHGTHIAGIIGAVANNNIGTAGVASNVKVRIMSLKINGGQNGTGSVSAAIEAIKYATMMGADICNLSWGTSQRIESLEYIIKESDMLFVAAAGNTGSNNDNNPIYPANLKLDNLISVTFINSLGELTNLSNYGATSVDLAAPGQDVFSLVVGSYGFMSGSSMAAPQVSGVAAILYSCSDDVYASDIKKMIVDNIKPIAGLKERIKNPGIPNAYQAVINAGKLKRDAQSPEISLSTVYDKEKIQIPVNIVDQGGSGVRAAKWLMGEETLKDFQRGMEGNAIEGTQISVLKAGIYTFYVSDYAGNETIKTYQVKADITPPKIALSYKMDTKKKISTITVVGKDMQSGIKRVKYMPGSRRIKDFLPADAGTKLTLKDGKGSFKVQRDGIYTVFISDYRGNQIVRSVVVKTGKATSIQFSKTSVVMDEGTRYKLQVSVKPLKSTDKITYVSSDIKIATVSTNGVVTARRKGRVSISAITSDKSTAVCTVTVK